MTFLQWLHGLFGHRWAEMADYCSDCGVSYTSVEDRDWFKVIRSREQRDWDNDGLTVQRCYAIEIFEQRFGVERSPIIFHGEPYMTRYILYLGPINLRLHKFFRGDDDRASHTHPWWFITIPFAPYRESLFKKGIYKGDRIVWPFIPNFRGRDFEHIVIGRVTWEKRLRSWMLARKADLTLAPFWTFVIAGSKSQTWGFYPEPNRFVPWWEFKP